MWPIIINWYGVWIHCKYLYSIDDLYGWGLEDDYERVIKFLPI
jgi:hypothetical protein